MFNQLEYQSVVLAALLHDIGKFLQRDSFGKLDITGKHHQVSANFVSAFSDYFKDVSDVSLLKTLIQTHHESPQSPSELQVQTISDHHNRALAYLVSKADYLPLAERGEQVEEWKGYKSVPLVSVFKRVKALYLQPCVPRFTKGGSDGFRRLSPRIEKCSGRIIKFG